MRNDDSTRLLTFLIVDDDIRLSLFFKETLTQLGHKVFVTVNEHGALEVLKQEPVDIMICDLILPGLDGTKIISIVKERYPRTCCVLISGHHHKLDAYNTTTVHADLVIGKPVLKETLSSIIEYYLVNYQETLKQL